MQHLRQLFEIIRQARLSINLDKCVFGKDSLIYLGFLINKDGYQPPRNRIKAIEEFPKPANVSQLRRFLGMLNYYRRCIPAAVQKQAPLHDLLQGLPKRSRAVLQWTDAADQAFDKCKRSIAEAVVPAFLAHEAPLALVTDASNSQIGAALEQQDNGAWRPIGFFSRKLSDTESRYSTYDRELLAVYAAVRFFQRILEGRQFTIKTDHRPLIYAADQHSDRASPRQQRQLDYILQFNVEWTHIKGEDNIVADTLSRTCTVSMPTQLDPAAISQGQQSCQELPHLLEATPSKLHLLSIGEQQVYCEISTGVVRPYMPVSLRRAAFNVVHGLAHPSRRATARLLAQKFFWPGLRKDAARWSRDCEPCQRAKVQRHNRSALGDFNAPDNRFDHVHIDIITLPLVRNLHHCLTVIDRFSRWPTAVPRADMQAVIVARAFYEHWICLYGAPLTISSDQGTQFESALFTALTKLVGAKRTRTTPYHPQANGMVERFHRTLKAALMCSPNTPWPDLLPSVLLGLRTAFKEDLQASPAEMLYGTSLWIPGEFFVTDSIPASSRDFVGKLRCSPRTSSLCQRQGIRSNIHSSSRTCRAAPMFLSEWTRSASHSSHRTQARMKSLSDSTTGRTSSRLMVLRRPFSPTPSSRPTWSRSIQHQSSQPTTTSPRLQSREVRHLQSSNHPPPQPPQQHIRRVSFPSSLHDEVTGEGVDVAVEPPRIPPAHPQAGGRRKQALIPRLLF